MPPTCSTVSASHRHTRTHVHPLRAVQRGLIETRRGRRLERRRVEPEMHPELHAAWGRRTRTITRQHNHGERRQRLWIQRREDGVPRTRRRADCRGWRGPAHSHARVWQRTVLANRGDMLARGLAMGALEMSEDMSFMYADHGSAVNRLYLKNKPYGLRDGR